MDNDFDIAGWKRYPVHKKIESYSLPTNKDGKVNTKVGTTFSPLDKGVVFEGKVRYHNLKKAELGALLSALNFHNTSECFHNIGMAKSLGYGKVKMEVKIDNKKLEEYLKSFELEITTVIPNWANSEQLNELVTMAVEQENEESSLLRYMKLEEFAKNKSRTKSYLSQYTSLDNIKTVSVKSLISDEELVSLKKIQEQKILEELERKEQEAKEEELRLIEMKKQEAIKKEIANKENLFQIALNSEDPQILQNFIDKYPKHEKIDEIKSKKVQLEQTKNENKHAKVDAKVKSAYEALKKKKGNPKQYTKELEKFIKKWSASKNNKGSAFILDLLEKLK